MVNNSGNLAKVWYTHTNVFLQGLSDGIFGPTLLDICDIYQNPVSIVGIVIVFKAIGSILGASLGLLTQNSKLVI